MSMDRSLKSANALIRHRNVLTRGERMKQLKEEGKWPEARSIFGLPKVGHRKMALAKTEKKEDADATAAPAAKGAKGAKGAAAIATGPNKTAAPGAKGATPAAKGAAPAKKK